MNSICIFGVFVADLCFFANKIPVKGETVLGNNYIVGPGGKGSNQAIAAARLNGEVNFITKLGKDSHSEMALSIYKEAGVNVGSVIQDPKLSTGVAGIMIDENGNNAINIFAGAAAKLKNEDIDKNLEFLKKSKVFLTQMETPDITTIYALKKASENGCLTILNPAPARQINKDEEYFIDAFKLKNEVIDTTGAGDAFNGAFAVALANDFKYKEALIFANKVAGISTTRLGAASSMPSVKEVEDY